MSWHDVSPERTWLYLGTWPTDRRGSADGCYEYVRVDVHDAEVKRLRDLVYVLTGLIAPRCYNCSRPATKHNARTASFGDAASQYACDEHATGSDVVRHSPDPTVIGSMVVPKKWHDLPAASAIREAMAIRPRSHHVDGPGDSADDAGEAVTEAGDHDGSGSGAT